MLEDEKESGFVAENLVKDEYFGESHLKVDDNDYGVLPTSIVFGIYKATNGAVSGLVDPTIEIVNVNFD